MRLRVVHIASGDLWAGAEVQLYHLASALVKRHDIALFVILLNHGELERRLREHNVHVAVFSEADRSFPGILLSIFRLLRHIRPHIVHTHRQKENILGSLAAALLPSARSIRTVHGAPEHSPSHQQLSKRLAHALDRLCGRFLQCKLISVSHDLAGKLAASFPPDRIRVVVNGLSLHPAIEGKTLPFGTPFHVAIAARLVPVKRIDIFLRAAALLQARAPNHYAFSVFGDGPLLTALTRLASDLGIEHVRFTGFLPNIMPELRRVDLLTITSDHEGTPMCLLEAMALGVPVLARSVGGIPAVLQYGRLGTLLDSDDPEAFADAIEAIRRNALEAIEKAALARDTAQSTYSASAMVESYVSLYWNALHTS